MKTKTIKSILRKKLDAVLATITDPCVRALVAEDTIITGGCIVSMLQQQNVNDYDLYFRTPETAFAVAQYYADKFIERTKRDPGSITATLSDEGRVNFSVYGSRNETVVKDEEAVADTEEGENPFEDEVGAEKPTGKLPLYTAIFLNSNAITLTNKVQMIIRFHGEPDEIHRNYDFVHCTSYWTSWNNELVLRKEALEAILTKELRYIGSQYPICSVIRTRKFINRGWTINAGQYLKMCFQISKLDLENIEVLKDQLVGVDSLYFMNLISELHKEGPITQGRLTELIDQIF